MLRSISRHLLAKICGVCITIVLLLAACGGGGGTSSQPQPPQITTFTAIPTDIAPGDSVNLSYLVTGADSTIVTPPRQKLATAASGSFFVKPVNPVQYALIAFNADGSDTATLVIPMANSVPDIQSASFDRDSIVLHDTLTLAYTIIRADSTRLSPGGILSPASSGIAKVVPIGTSTYRLIAYNAIGSDTFDLPITVEIPHDLKAKNGMYYKGKLDSSTLTPPLSFRCQDLGLKTLFQPWIHLVRTSGDGQVSADSLRPDNSGYASFTYSFSDTLGAAGLRAFVRGFDTVNVVCRADAIILGEYAQAQYVRLNDHYSDVTSFDGLPIRTYWEAGYPLVYADYGDSVGVVVVVLDADLNDQPDASEEVFSVILFGPYKGRTPTGVGIGSPYHELVSAYGQPDQIWVDPAGAGAYLISYTHLGLYVKGSYPDTVVTQIEVATSSSSMVSPRGLIRPAAQSGWIRVRSLPR